MKLKRKYRGEGLTVLGCKYVCTYVCMYIHIMYIYIYIHTYICIGAATQFPHTLYEHAYIYIYIYTYTRIYIYVYTYISKNLFWARVGKGLIKSLLHLLEI